MPRHSHHKYHYFDTTSLFVFGKSQTMVGGRFIPDELLGETKRSFLEEIVWCVGWKSLRDLVLYDWPKQGDHKFSPIINGPFVVVRPVGDVCYEIKSRTPQNKFVKVVHVQHLRPYFKRNADVIQNNTTDEKNDQDPADPQDVSVTTQPSSSRHYLNRNNRPTKRF
ncbi:uncharacterized protein TNCV_2294121 [Trichonephila clavipes]|nr:uncharacterized protein TNCV_2294121 [Trichonephila clavipes]